MPTIITSDIDSGGGADYTTLQAWEDDHGTGLNNDLVANDEQHVANCLSGHNESGSTTLLTIAGQTVDATRNLVVTVASSASFADTDSNRLEYDTANGVYLTSSVSYTSTVVIQTDHTEIRRLQVRNSNGSDGGALETFSGGSNSLIENCILNANVSRGSGSGVVSYNNETSVDIVNVLVQCDAPKSGAIGIALGATAGGRIVNVTVVCPEDVTANGTGISTNYARPDIVNCASFGWGTCFAKTGGAGWSAATDNNASEDATAPDTTHQRSLTYTSEFVDATSTGTLDYKLASGGNLEGNAVQHALTNDLDIFGNARDVSTPDIGCFELQAAGGANPKGPLGLPLHGPFGGPV